LSLVKGVALYGLTQDLPHLFFHAAAVPCGAHAQAQLDAVVQVADGQGGQGNTPVGKETKL